MGFELSKVEYYVIENRVYRESDAPHCGMTLVEPRGSKEYGPFDSKRIAKNNLDSLEGTLISEGWTKIERDGKNSSELYNTEGVNAYLGVQKKVLECRPVANITVKRLNLWV